MIAPIMELLSEVQHLGVTLRAEGDRLRFAPRDRLPAELVGRLKERKPEVIAALATAETPTEEKPNALAARRREAMTSDERQVVTSSNASMNAVAIGEPAPCPTCGSAIFWRTRSGTASCMGCKPQPADAVKAIIVTLDGRNAWADYEAEAEAVRYRRDSQFDL